MNEVQAQEMIELLRQIAMSLDKIQSAIKMGDQNQSRTLIAIQGLIGNATRGPGSWQP